MILKRIRDIKNTGQFFTTTMNGGLDKDFTKMSLIYGLNGFGKSTLSEIIRSLKENNPTAIENKRSLPERGSPYIKLSFAPDFSGSSRETSIVYSPNAWSGLVDNLEIFDCKFISENVYSDFEITHEHKKKISALILGDAGVLIAKEIEGIQKSINETKRQQSETSGKISVLIPKKYTGTVNEFIAISEKEKEKIKEKSKLEKALKTILEVGKVQKLALPEEIAVKIDITQSEFTTAENILGSSLDTVSSDAVEKVRKHIAENLDSRGEDWLQKGLNYHKDDTCPFCTQKTDGSDAIQEIISAYTKFFSTEYEAYVNKINNDIRTSSSTLTKKINSASSLSSVFDRNNLSVNNAKDYIEETTLIEIASSFSDLEEEIKTKSKDFIESIQVVKADIDAKLLAKTQNPLIPIKLATYDYHLILSKEEDLNKTIEKYNTVVAKVKGIIENIKKAPASENQGDIEKGLLQIEVAQIRYAEPAIGLITSLQTIGVTLSALDKQKVAKEAELVAHNKTVADNYLKEANDVLKGCGCRFTIRIPDDFSKRGSSPVIDLGFELLGENIDGKKFGEILSESDKRCLAFALFIAKLNTDAPTLKDKIVILDDPFTSLDDNRQDTTIFQIKKLESKCAQVIVLCHYSQPIAELANDFKSSLQLSIENNPSTGSVLVQKDLVKLRNNKHLCNLDELQNVLDNTIPDDQFPTTRATIRTVLEYEILSRFRPNLVTVSERTLGNLITELDSQVQAGKAILKGANPNDVILELRHINSKTAPEHHGDPTNSSNTDNIQNLRALISQTFEVIYKKL